jgi:hypothetical protein
MDIFSVCIHPYTITRKPIRCHSEFSVYLQEFISSTADLYIGINRKTPEISAMMSHQSNTPTIVLVRNTVC